MNEEVKDEGVLGSYEGRPIDASTLTIRNTGHGFEQAMQVDPVRLPLHGKVYLIIEAEVEKHRFDPIDDSEGLTLVNMLKADRSTIVDREIVEKYLDEQERRIQEAKGEPMLEFPEGEAPVDGFGLDDLDDEDDD